MRSAVLDSALADADADAFAHVGPSGDPVIQYVSGASVPCRAAVVYDGGVSVIPARALPGRVSFSESVAVRDPASVPARRLPGVVSGTVLAPRTLPHDAALYLDGAGVEFASTDAHVRARARKTDAELDAVRAAQAAAEAGMAAAAGVLAAAAGDPLADDEGVVTAERVRRAANAAMAREGATPETVVGVDGELGPRDAVPVRVTPRVRGYHGLLARTFVAASDGGWERRATLAAEYAVDAAMDVVDVGETTAARAAEEAVAELGSYGFPPTAAAARVHGVGLESREAPGRDDAIEAGAVLGVGVEVDADQRVWLADLAAANETGVGRVGSFPRSVVPKPDY